MFVCGGVLVCRFFCLVCFIKIAALVLSVASHCLTEDERNTWRSASASLINLLIFKLSNMYNDLLIL